MPIRTPAMPNECDGRKGEAEMMKELPIGAERRMVLRLLHHWRAARRDKQLPSLDAVYRHNLGDIARHLIVLELTESEPVFRLIGPYFAEKEGVSPMDLPVSSAGPGTLLERAVHYYPRVLEHRVPITLGDRFVDRQGRSVLYRSIILPISGDGVLISQLLCAANGRIAGGGEG